MGPSARDRLLDLYYYLVPLWLFLEWAFFPGTRADIVFGGSAAGRLGFYGAEAAIGAGLWFGKPFARPAALVENAAWLLFALKFVLLGPLDIAMNADAPGYDMAAAGAAYARAVPAVLYSSLHVVFRLSSGLGALGGPRP